MLPADDVASWCC